MNVFILNAGRSGSTTFVRACEHMTNFSAAHESRTGQVGGARLAYPDRHIEADNRLVWLLGRLERAYGDRAFYVHLHRERAATAKSFAMRAHQGIMRAYRQDILLGSPPGLDARVIAEDYLDTTETNIELFLRGKRRTMRIDLETAHEDFPKFWHAIGAEGDLAAALAEFDQRHNASRERPHGVLPKLRVASTAFIAKTLRVVRGIPSFVRYA